MTEEEKMIREQKKRIDVLRDVIAESRRWETAATARAERCCDEIRKLRDACRSTNRGITRLGKRVQSQAKKIAELKMLLGDALTVLNHYSAAPTLRENIDIALHGRRPAEKAT